MELTQLHYFVVVAKCESLTKAASELYITQSALSRSISKLEAELGTHLFERNGGRLTLNTIGTEFLVCAEQTLQTLNAGVQHVKQQLEDRVIRIADCAATNFMVQITDRCQMKFPLVDIELTSYEQYCQTPELPIDQYDIILTPEKYLNGFMPVTSYAEKWIIICNKNYRFRSDYTAGTITAAQLAEEPFTFFGCASDRRFLQQLLGSDANIADAPEMRTTAHEINRSRAIGCIPIANLEYLLKNEIPIRVIAIDDARSERTMYLQRHNRFLRNSDDYGIMQIITDYIGDKRVGWERLYQSLL